MLHVNGGPISRSWRRQDGFPRGSPLEWPPLAGPTSKKSILVPRAGPLESTCSTLMGARLQVPVPGPLESTCSTLMGTRLQVPVPGPLESTCSTLMGTRLLGSPGSARARANGFAVPRRGIFLLRQPRALQTGTPELLVIIAVPFPKTGVPGQGKSSIPQFSARNETPQGHWAFHARWLSGKIEKWTPPKNGTVGVSVLSFENVGS